MCARSATNTVCTASALEPLVHGVRATCTLFVLCARQENIRLLSSKKTLIAVREACSGGPGNAAVLPSPSEPETPTAVAAGPAHLSAVAAQLSRDEREFFQSFCEVRALASASVSVAVSLVSLPRALGGVGGIAPGSHVRPGGVRDKTVSVRADGCAARAGCAHPEPEWQRAAEHSAEAKAPPSPPAEETCLRSRGGDGVPFRAAGRFVRTVHRILQAQLVEQQSRPDNTEWARQGAACPKRTLTLRNQLAAAPPRSACCSTPEETLRRP